MTLLYYEAFEDSLDTTWNAAGTFVTGRNGKCLSVGAAGQINCSPAVSPTGFVIGYAHRVSALGSSVVFRNSNAVQTQISLALTSDGKYTLYLGQTSDTQIGKSSTVFAINSWNYVEMKMGAAGFANTGGTIEVRVNGTTEITYSGDTLFGSGSAALVTFIISGGGVTVLTDDMYLLDLTGSAPFNDFLGDCRIEQLLPNGAGATTQWTPSTGSNFSCVDETPPNAGTDYVGSTTSGQRDLYTMADLTSTTGTVLAVRPVFNLAKSDTGVDPAMRAVIRGSDGTIKQQATMPAQSITYVTRPGFIETTQPNGSAWSIADVNGMQMGQEIV